MSLRVRFRFRFENVIKKYEQDSRVAEIALAGCCARVDGIKSEINARQNINQRLAEAWSQSLQTNSVASIESRLVFHKERQALLELQTQLRDGQADVEKARERLVAISQRLHSIALIRERDLALYQRELKHKTERETLEIVLRKKLRRNSEETAQ